MREEKGEQVVIREILPKHRMVDSVLAPGQWEEAVFVRNSAAPPNEEILFQETETQSEPAQAVKTRSEEHTSELQSHSFISYAVFCLKKKKKK